MIVDDDPVWMIIHWIIIHDDQKYIKNLINNGGSLPEKLSVELGGTIGQIQPAFNQPALQSCFSHRKFQVI